MPATDGLQWLFRLSQSPGAGGIEPALAAGWVFDVIRGCREVKPGVDIFPGLLIHVQFFR